MSEENAKDLYLVKQLEEVLSNKKVLEDNLVNITRDDLNLIINLLIIINKRGGFLLEEYISIGELYSKLVLLKK